MQNPAELERHRPFLARLARGLVADPGAADDLVQDTWLTALSRPLRARARLTRRP